MGRCGQSLRGEPEKLAALRAAVQPLVSENRALLAPSAAVGRALLEFIDAWRDLRQRLDVLVELAKPTEAVTGPLHADGALERVQGVLSGWQSAKRPLNPWCLWRNSRDTAIAQRRTLRCAQNARAVELGPGRLFFDALRPDMRFNESDLSKRSIFATTTGCRGMPLIHVATWRLLCSVRSRSPPAGVFSVCAIKPTFRSATPAGLSGSDARYS